MKSCAAPAIILNLGGFGGAFSSAYDINDSGVVVGTANNTSGAYRAFQWRDGAMTDLNTLIAPGSGWILESAVSVNDYGWIIGRGTYNGGSANYILKPVPEPSSLLTLICGLGGLAALRRRR